MGDALAGRTLEQVDAGLAVTLTAELCRVPSVLGDEGNVRRSRRRALHAWHERICESPLELIYPYTWPRADRKRWKWLDELPTE
jgi:hypothetical protein